MVSLKMSCNSETNQNFKFSQILYMILFLLYMCVQLSASPSNIYNDTTAVPMNTTSNNSDGDDLYVIKAVVYEIGILTDANNTTMDTTERQEEIKLSFYNPPSNNSGP